MCKDRSNVFDRTHVPTHELLTAGGQNVTTDTKGNITQIPAALRPNASSLLMNWAFDNRMNTADVGSDGSVDLTYKFDAIGRRVFRDNGTTATIYVQAGLLPLEKWNDVLMILWLRLAWFVLFVAISLIPSAWYSFQWITRSYRYSHTLSVFFPVLVAEFVAICSSSAILLRFKSQNTSYFVIAMNCVVAALVSAFAFATFRFIENAN